MKLDISGGVRTGRLVISSGGRPREARALAELVPTEPGRLTVIMERADPAATGELAGRLRRWVPKQWRSVRLVAPGAAAAVGDCPARNLSDALGVEVLAPDGRLVLVPDGCLFVARSATSTERGPGAWWRFRPGQPPARAGRRFPTPAWEDEMAAFTDPGSAGFVVEEVPCGLWLRREARVRENDLAFSAPMRVDSVLLLVSRPGDPGLPAAEVGRAVRAIPEVMHDRLIVVPYGDRPLVDGHLGAVAALAAGRPIRFRTGLPLFVPGRGRVAMVVGADGTPTWRPFARELLWRPDGGGRLRKWTPPADHLVPIGPGVYALDGNWQVEVTESGLWVREHDRIERAGLIRGVPLDSRYCVVAVGGWGASGAEPAQPPWPAIVRLLRKLPDDAGSRVRLAVPPTAGNWLAQAATWACRYVLPLGSIVVLADNGEMAPWPLATRRVST